MKTGVLIVWGENPLGQLGSEWRRSNSIRKDKQCVNKTFKSRPILLLTAEICDDVMRGFVWWRVVWGRPFTWSSAAVSQVLQHGSNYISLIWWNSEELNKESRSLLLLFSFFFLKKKTLLIQIFVLISQNCGIYTSVDCFEAAKPLWTFNLQILPLLMTLLGCSCFYSCAHVPDS